MLSSVNAKTFHVAKRPERVVLVHGHDEPLQTRNSNLKADMTDAVMLEQDFIFFRKVIISNEVMEGEVIVLTCLQRAYHLYRRGGGMLIQVGYFFICGKHGQRYTINVHGPILHSLPRDGRCHVSSWSSPKRNGR